jgi:hypothetical protein
MNTNSLADDFVHGKIEVTLPASTDPVSYQIRIYPAFDPAALLAAAENQIGPINIAAKDIQIGFTACCDYCNETSGEIVHRFELIRTTKDELYSALRDHVHAIADERQARVYWNCLYQNNLLGPEEPAGAGNH